MGSRFEWFLKKENPISRTDTPYSVSHWKAVEDGRFERSSPEAATHWGVKLPHGLALLPRPHGSLFRSQQGFEGITAPDQISDAKAAWLDADGQRAELLQRGHLR
jgi:hypothetical protein